MSVRCSRSIICRAQVAHTQVTCWCVCVCCISQVSLLQNFISVQFIHTQHREKNGLGHTAALIWPTCCTQIGLYVSRIWATSHRFCCFVDPDRHIPPMAGIWSEDHILIGGEIMRKKKKKNKNISRRMRGIRRRRRRKLLLPLALPLLDFIKTSSDFTAALTLHSLNHTRIPPGFSGSSRIFRFLQDLQVPPGSSGSFGTRWFL